MILAVFMWMALATLTGLAGYVLLRSQGIVRKVAGIALLLLCLGFVLYVIAPNPVDQSIQLLND